METRISKLKKWRDELASRSGKPAYYILTNKNLEDAISLNPSNPEKLESLSGWGPKKIEKYGQEVLGIINDTSGRESESSFIGDSELEGPAVLSVAQYINFINITLQQFNEIKVTGEISDLSGIDRGLAFFDLKDKDDHESTMQCVVFRNNFRYLSHLLEEGLEVVIYGIPSIYPKNGNFKFVITRIEPVGEGGYKKSLEVLKKKLTEKGYFAEERKRKLPEVIGKIGLVTSGNGAAIHDFQRNLADFGFEVLLKNVYVEGDMAENSIINALDFFNRQADNFDVLVVIRGGGSLESLKAYNSEKVVEATISSKIPVVTGVGHESDETLVGLSSDMDCSTPSIVATYLSRTREDVLNRCDLLTEELLSKEEKLIDQFEIKISNQLLVLGSGAERLFNQFEQKKQKMFNLLGEKIFQISSALQNVDILAKKLEFGVENILKNKESFLVNSRIKINTLNPENILEKGYGIVKNKNGKILDSIEKIKRGSDIKIQLRDGEVEAKTKN